MIKLELIDKPKELTDEIFKKLTKEFKNTKSDVWNKKFIRESVLELSYSKCCYTECKLQVESKYMEVDHFYPKKHFPNKVVEWGNLLPCCKKSNTTKGELNTKRYPIINPLIDDPKDHLFIKAYRFYDKTPTGRRTIDNVAINDNDHFVKKRFEIGTKVIQILEDIWLNINENQNNIINNPTLRNRYLTKLKNLLNECTRKNEYSATTSTVILEDSYYKKIYSFLCNKKFWDDELNKIKKDLIFCSLPEKKNKKKKIKKRIKK